VEAGGYAIYEPQILEDGVLNIVADIFPECGSLVVERNGKIVARVWMYHAWHHENNDQITSVLVLEKLYVVDLENDRDQIIRCLRKWCACVVDAGRISDVYIDLDIDVPRETYAVFS